jgi:hypothetical protein
MELTTTSDALEVDLTKLGDLQKIKLSSNKVFTHILERQDFARILDLLKKIIVKTILSPYQDSKRFNPTALQL